MFYKCLLKKYLYSKACCVFYAIDLWHQLLKTLYVLPIRGDIMLKRVIAMDIGKNNTPSTSFDVHFNSLRMLLAQFSCALII
jgi:hypothetical protein